MDNYLEINRILWDEKTQTHIESDFYNLKEFLAGKSSLNTIENDLLGEIKGKSILHLQCHFGMDSLSLARKGAKITGVDFSEKAIEKAKSLASSLHLDAHFICSDVYSTREVVKEKYDCVYTSYGTIGWLPDLDKWAEVIRGCLKPDGKLVFVEFHPVVWIFDDFFEEIKYSYFKREPIIEEIQGTYADKDAPIGGTCISWNHGLSEVIRALMKAGLQIDDFQEYNYSPYPAFEKVIEVEEGKFQIEPLADKIPLVYSIVASPRA